MTDKYREVLRNKHDICANCGHYFFLHENNFGKKECQACDSPEYPIEKKCPEFKLKEDKERIIIK